MQLTCKVYAFVKGLMELQLESMRTEVLQNNLLYRASFENITVFSLRKYFISLMPAFIEKTKINLFFQSYEKML